MNCTDVRQPLRSTIYLTVCGQCGHVCYVRRIQGPTLSSTKVQQYGGLIDSCGKIVLDGGELENFREAYLDNLI